MARARKRGGRANRRTSSRLVFLCAGVLAAVAVGLGVLNGPLAWPVDEGVPTALRQAVVATDVLNVRAAPGTDAPIIGSLTQGAVVTLVGDGEDGWAPIRFGEGYGWLSTSYLAIEGQDAPAVIDVPEVAAAGAPAAPSDPPAPAGQSTDPAPPADVPGERWIDIDRGTATVTLYEGDVAIASFTGKIGRDPAADGFYSTAVGTYHVYSMNKGLAPTPFAEDTYLTDWVGFDPVRKNGIHSPVRDREGNEKPWQNPATLGCVRLEAAAAETVFAFAEFGMRVEVHD